MSKVRDYVIENKMDIRVKNGHYLMSGFQSKEQVYDFIWYMDIKQEDLIMGYKVNDLPNEFKDILSRVDFKIFKNSVFNVEEIIDKIDNFLIIDDDNMEVYFSYCFDNVDDDIAHYILEIDITDMYFD